MHLFRRLCCTHGIECSLTPNVLPNVRADINPEMTHCCDDFRTSKEWTTVNLNVCLYVENSLGPRPDFERFWGVR